MLEKEVQTRETLRTANTELTTKLQHQQEQYALVNRVLQALELKHSALVEENERAAVNATTIQARADGFENELKHYRADALEESSRQQERTECGAKIRQWEKKCAAL